MQTRAELVYSVHLIFQSSWWLDTIGYRFCPPSGLKNPGRPRDQSPRAQQFHLLGGPGGPDMLQNRPFRPLLCRFEPCCCFIHFVGTSGRLEPFSSWAPRPGPPTLNSLFQACGNHWKLERSILGPCDPWIYEVDVSPIANMPCLAISWIIPNI